MNFIFIIIKRLGFVLLLAIVLTASAQRSRPVISAIPESGDEFAGPFKSWLNAKTGFGAKGDGLTDDTGALQAAMDAAAKGNLNSTLYLPAGIYLISKTLTLNNHINISIVGSDPANTIIKWAGAKQGTMLLINGTAYSKFDRLTWDGNYSAEVAVEQSWDGSHPHFDTSNEYADDVFINVGFGIRGGSRGHGFAETTILRDRFIRNSKAGVSLGNFNALDIWIRNSLFQDCTVGITNVYGAGNFKVYSCIFRNSSNCDISMNNTGEFSIRENTSINSNQFFNAAGSRNPAAITIIGNTVIDPIITAAITIGNQGPVTFINNVVRSRPAVTFGPVVVFKCQGNADSFSMGNTFNVANAISTDDNNIVYDNKVVSSEKLKNLGEPKLPGTEPNYHRRIFEVPIGADAAAIQSIINMAASAQAKRPVVHFPYGIFNITSTLVIPANAAIQLIGDGFGNEHATVLQWTGSTAGPILLLTGPSKVMIQDMTFKGKSGITNIRVDNADQKGARVFLQEFNQSGGETGLSVDQLDHTMVFAYDTQFSGMKKAISVTGGPLALNDKPTEGRTIIYSGAESNNMVSHEVSNGGNLIVQDSWYEGGIKSTYAKLSGKCIFTADGDHISTPQHTDVPSVIVDNFSGKALFLGDDLTDRFSISGNGLQSKILAIGMLTEDDPAISDTSSPKADMRLLLSRTRNYGSKIIQGGSYPIANIGGYNQSYFYEMLRSMLQVHSITLSALPANTTDIRFYRVMSINGSYGLHITGLK